jgi:predicted small metal-binding protein
VSTPVRDVFTRAKKEHDAMKIQEIDIQDYARQLLEAHGAHAVVEAAQKACAFEMEGKKEDAEIWRHIEAAMKLMRGPHES